MAAASPMGAPAPAKEVECKGAALSFQLKFGKELSTIDTLGDQNTIGDLRQVLLAKTGVPAALQKIMFKGMQRDDTKTLQAVGIRDKVKVMMVGSSIDQVMKAAQGPTADQLSAQASLAEGSAAVEENLQEQTKHRKVLDKGIPEGVEPGLVGNHASLPEGSINNVLNNIGLKVRLTFKKFTEELWVQSASNTQKLHFAQIRKIIAEPIKEHPEYHMMGLQLGSGDGSTLWLYWVPSQYVNAIRYTVMADYS